MVDKFLILNNKMDFNSTGSEEDIIHVISKLKKRMTPQEYGIPLVEEIKYFERPKLIPIPKIDLNDLREFNESFYEFFKKIFDHDKLADFQFKGLIYLNSMLNEDNNTPEVLALQAPTGSGKTDVFLYPLLYDSITKNRKFILVYPRTALATDQLKKLIEVVIKLRNNKLINDDFSIGLLYGNIGAIDKHTYDYNELIFKKIEKKDSKYLIIKDMKCPICNNGEIYAKYYERKNEGIIDKFKCSNDNCELNKNPINLYVSKKSIIENKPNVIITTVESLNSIMFRPDFADIIKKISGIVFDEAHTYFSVYGAHVANFIRRLKELNKSIKIVLSSATIPNPLEFAEKLTGVSGNKIIEIKPSNEELNYPSLINKDIPKEKYYIIKATDGKNEISNSPSTLIELLLLLGHSINLNTKNGKERTLIFFDSRDVLIREFINFEDADKTRKLFSFRITKNLPEELSEYKCPLSNQNDCNFYYLKNCKVYKSGECWYGLSKVIFKNNIQPKTSPLKIDRSMSEDSTYDLTSDIVFSTSTLELGINDKQISTIIQYRAPYSIFNFIQRKGRAGRIINEDSKIFMVLANKSSDRFYFNNIESMLNENYILPLNPENPYAKWINDITYKIREKIIAEYNNPIYEKDYISQLTALYEVLLKITNNDFKNFIINYIGSDRINIINKKNYYKSNIERGIKELESKINQIIEKFKNPNPFNYIRKQVVEAKSLCNNKDDQDKLDEFLKYIDKYERLIYFNKIDVKEEEKKIIKEMYNILTDILSDKKDECSKEYYEKIKLNILALIDEIKDYNNTKDNLEKLNKYEKEIKSLNELKELFDYWDLFMVFKKFYKSWFYYCASKKDNETQNINEFLPKYLIPDSFFSKGEHILLNTQDDLKTISIIDLINNYTPHRLPVLGSRDIINYLTVDYQLIKYNFNNEKKLMDVFINLKVRGHEEPLNNSGLTIIKPQEIYARKINMSSEEDNTFKICPRCFYVGNSDEKYCAHCGINLVDATIRSTPLYDVVLNSLTEEFELFGIEKLLTNIKYYLKGEDVKIFYSDEESNKKISRKAIIHFDPIISDTVEKMPTLRIKVQKLTEEEMNKFQFLSFKSLNAININSIYYHSIAHLFVKTVSYLSGVSIEELDYFIEEKENEGYIYIFEKSDGDTGIIDSFLQRIEKNPFDLIKTFNKFVSCKSAEIDFKLTSIKNLNEEDKRDYYLMNRIKNLESRKINEDEIQKIAQEFFNSIKQNDGKKIRELMKENSFNFIIQCADGCPDCLYLNSCHSDDQEANVSRNLAKYYVEKVQKKISIKDFKNNYLKKLINMEGFIYERGTDYIIWIRL